MELSKQMAEAWNNFSFLVVCPDPSSSDHMINLRWHIFTDIPNIMNVSDSSVEKIFDTLQFKEWLSMKEFLPIWKKLPVHEQDIKLAEFIEKLRAT